MSVWSDGLELRTINEHVMTKSHLLHHLHLARLTVSLAAAMMFFASASVAVAQLDYKTPQAAAEALIVAVKDGDAKAILAVLGPDGEDIISSGDKVADEQARKRFIDSYDTEHQITMESEYKAVLIIGDNDYPFAIPLERVKTGLWSFDTREGRKEILYRRIGHNELQAIQTCLAYVDAQYDYADKDRTGAGAGVYARRFVSQEGKHDGLYWPGARGEESPLGELFAKASHEGYRPDEGRIPYHGYYYKILTGQGPAATGGTADYIVHGKMIGGFALVAYPAAYRNSGVMTFIVNHQGTVFQKDLGPDFADLAEAMTSFNPGAGWKKVDVNEAAK